MRQHRLFSYIYTNAQGCGDKFQWIPALGITGRHPTLAYFRSFEFWMEEVAISADPSRLGFRVRVCRTAYEWCGRRQKLESGRIRRTLYRVMQRPYR